MSCRRRAQHVPVPPAQDAEPRRTPVRHAPGTVASLLRASDSRGASGRARNSPPPCRTTPASASLTCPCPCSTGAPRVTLRHASTRPYDAAIAAARTCYSPRVIGADEITAAQRETIGPLTFEGGHHTVCQHAHFEFGLENVSRQFVWSFLHSHPFYNSEQSLAALRRLDEVAGTRAREPERRGARRLRGGDRVGLGQLPPADGAAEARHPPHPGRAAAPHAERLRQAHARRSSARPRRRRSRPRAT